jgi:hypothetical protein
MTIHLAISHPLFHSEHANHFINNHVHCQTSTQASDLDLDGKNIEATKFHKCSADSGLIDPDEAVIEVRLWWLNIISTKNEKPEKGLSASQLSSRTFLKHDCI